MTLSLTAAAPPSSRSREEFALCGQLPSAAVAPTTADETAEVLRSAAAAGAVCVPWGGGVRQSMGRLPPRYDLAISTENLCRLVDVQPGDLTVTVEAGMTLAELERLLSEHRQFVALESPYPDRETIGGILATGASGLLSFGYGPPRDQVIGMAVAMADGTVIRGGGRVVKNVAGYDLCKLFTGSQGTLGIIVEATFRVRPQPAEQLTWVGAFPSAAAAEQALAAILDSSARVTFLQAADPAAAASLAQSVTTPVSAFGSDAETWLLAAGCDGHPDLARWSAAECSRLSHSFPTSTMEGAPSNCLRQEWTRRCWPDAPLALQIALPSSETLSTMEFMREQAAANAISLESTTAAGNGLIYAGLECPDPSRLPLFVQMIREHVTALPGNCIVLRAPEGARAQIEPWGHFGDGLRLMKAIRERLDPGETLNRGRLLGPSSV